MSNQPGTTAGKPQKPVLKKKHAIPFIWILPLLAALIGAGLVIKSILDAGVSIKIIFDTAEGIEAGKTKLVYRGLEVARVKAVELNPDLQSVTVHIDIPRSAEKHLKSNAQFWLVKPEISLAGVTGLGTLLSGNYIAVKPGGGKKTRKFRALPKPPPHNVETPGLHITLTADKLGSLRQDAPIFYRQILVGRVQEHSLAEDGNSVKVNIFINEEYEYLVRKSSRFWNASGISISGGLSGLAVETESLASVLSGGLAFFTPESDEATFPSVDGDTFPLYSNFKIAEAGIDITLHLQDGEGLKEHGTRIMFEGIEIGTIEKISVEKDLNGVIARASLDPRATPLLTTATRFWRVSPNISLTKISGLSTLLSGEYIAMQPGEGKPRTDFTVLEEPPVLPDSVPGLHFRLKADDLGSLSRGTSIYYKRIPVGNIQAYQLDKSGSQVIIDVYIEEKYAHLVRRNTRFWNTSGLDLSGSVTDFRLRTDSITSIISGGIAFATPDNNPSGAAAKNGSSFTLYPDYDTASENDTLFGDKREPGLHISARTTDLGSLAAGSPVLYKRITVGQVDGYRLDKDNETVLVQLTVRPRYTHLVHKNSRFWNASGFEFSGGLGDFHLKSESVKSILAGGIAFDTPDKPAGVAGENAVFPLYKDARSAMEDSIPIQITFNSATGLSAGADINYQDIQVGRVTEVKLRNDRNGVTVQADLFGSARHLAKTGTRFWVVSAELGLARNEHLGTLITGNYIAVQPGNGDSTSSFTGLDHAPFERHLADGLNLQLTTHRLGSIDAGDPVYYRQIPVGSVIGYELGTNASEVIVFINIRPYYEPLVRSNSTFWNASGIRVDASVVGGVKIDADSLETILDGGIAFATPDNPAMGDAASQGMSFELHDKHREKWLSWSPKIPLGSQ
ncbi:MAG: MlaD family protein [Pseudomonadota bacterium]